MTNAECIQKIKNWVRVCKERKPNKVQYCQKVLDIVKMQNPKDLVSNETQKIVTTMMQKVM